MRKLAGVCVWLAACVVMGACVPAAEPESKGRQDGRPLTLEAHSTNIGFMGTEEPIVVPKAGGEWLLKWYRPEYIGPWTLVAVDTATGAVKTVAVARGKLNLHLAPYVVASDGKLYVSALDRRMFVNMLVFDPATGDWTMPEAPLWSGLKGETHPLSIGPDGALYFFGSHPTGSAACVRYDPATGQKQEYGPLGPQPKGGCWVGSGAADDRYLYIAAGRVPYYLVRHDRVTGESSVLATTTTGKGGYMVVSPRSAGAEAALTNPEGEPVGERVFYWLYQGQLIRKTRRNEEPPWGREEPRRRGPAATSQATFSDLDDEGKATVSWRGRYLASYSVPKSPVGVGAPALLPNGKLLLPLANYQGIALMDPATGTAQRVAKFGLSHYATVIAGGKVYLSGYASGALYVYDPALPGGPDNPRLLANLKDVSGCHKITSGALGADGRVYFCGQWYRDGNGGGLAWYDPATGRPGGMWEPFVTFQTQCMTATTDGRYIVFTSKRVEDLRTGQPKPKQGRLFVWDTQTQRVSGWCDPVPDAKCAGRVVGVSPTEVVGWAPAATGGGRSVLYKVDVSSGQVTASRAAPFACDINDGAPDNALFTLAPDGKVLLFGGGLRRVDPRDLGDALIGTATVSGKGCLVGSDLWFGSGPTVYRAPGVVRER